MQENKFRKSIDLPKGPEFRKDLKRLALDRDFNSSKEMIEHDVIKQVEKYNQEAKKG